MPAGVGMGGCWGGVGRQRGGSGGAFKALRVFPPLFSPSALDPQTGPTSHTRWALLLFWPLLTLRGTFPEVGSAPGRQVASGIGVQSCQDLRAEICPGLGLVSPFGSG